MEKKEADIVKLEKERKEIEEKEKIAKQDEEEVDYANEMYQNLESEKIIHKDESSTIIPDNFEACIKN